MKTMQRQVLFLMVMAMGTMVGGLSIQNSNAVNSSVSNPHLEYQDSFNGNLDKVLSRSKRDGGVITGAIGAAIAGAGVITSGSLSAASGAFTGTSHLSYNRNVEITIKNYLQYPLVGARASRWYGQIAQAPSAIAECSLGTVAAHKTGHSATGTSGYVVWGIEQKNVLIFVFWDVPYSGCNAMTLYIVYGGYDTGLITGINPSLFYQTAEIKRANSHFKGRITCSSTSEFCVKISGVRVCGSFGTSSAQKISVRVEEHGHPLECIGVATRKVVG